MKYWLLGACLLSLLGLSGCTWLHPKPASAEATLSSGRNPKGPGLFDGKYGSKDGLVIYSNNPKEPSLIGHKQPQGTGGTASASSSGTTASQATPSPSQASSAPPQYRQFQTFQEYERFKKLPKDSPQYREFQQWLQWKHYQQWKAGQKQ